MDQPWGSAPSCTKQLYSSGRGSSWSLVESVLVEPLFPWVDSLQKHICISVSNDSVFQRAQWKVCGGKSLVTRFGVSGLSADCFTVKVELPLLPKIWFLDCRLTGRMGTGSFSRRFLSSRLPVYSESWSLAPVVTGSLHKENQRRNSHQLEMQLSPPFSCNCNSYALRHISCRWTMGWVSHLRWHIQCCVRKRCQSSIYIVLLLKTKLTSQLTSN